MPINLAVHKNETMATYMKSKFAEMLWKMDSTRHQPTVVPHPGEWSLEYAVEVDLAVLIIAQAFNKQSI